jgi:hypothetical protein
LQEERDVPLLARPDLRAGKAFVEGDAAGHDLANLCRLDEDLFLPLVRVEGFALLNRMGARFAGRSRLTVYEDRVAVAGPRVPRRLYESWVWIQGLLLALAIPLLVAAGVTLEWRWLVVAVVTFFLSYGISFGGAGLWPGLGELFDEEGRFMAVEFPRDSMREVDIGRGWAKGGFEVVLFPYKAGIDKMSAGIAVPFFAPGEHGYEARIAFSMYTAERTREFADLLKERETRPGFYPGPSMIPARPQARKRSDWPGSVQLGTGSRKWSGPW